MSALNFPNPDEMYDMNPDWDGIYKYAGIEYKWDPTSNSWLILSAASVTKNYVDSRDALRLLTTGDNHMHGNLLFRKNSSATSSLVNELRHDGSIILRNRKTITFSPSDSDNDDKGYIKFGPSGSPKELFAFSHDYVWAYQTLHFDSVHTDTMIVLENKGKENLVLFDIIVEEGVSVGASNNIIRIPEGDLTTLSISNARRDLFKISGEGDIKFTADVKNTFLFNNTVTEDTKDWDIFTIDTVSHQVRVSPEYNAGLCADTERGQVTTPNGRVSYDFVDPELVATKGYVDKKQNALGTRVTAEREEDTEIGGFWMEGGNLFLRIS